MTTTTRDRVLTIIVEHTGITEIQDNDTFADDLNCDSLDMLELGMAIEDEFGLSIPDGDLDTLRTVGRAVEYVEGRLS